MSYVVNSDLLFSLRESFHDRYIDFVGWDVVLTIPGDVTTDNVYGDVSLSNTQDLNVKMYIDESTTQLLGDFQKYFEEDLPIHVRFKSDVPVVEHAIITVKMYDRYKKDYRENKFEVIDIDSSDRLTTHMGSTREVTIAPYRG